MAEDPTPHGLTRREALKRGATIAGALVWATPVVQAVGMSRAFANDTSPLPSCCAGIGRERFAVLTMEYLGGGCTITNTQHGKATCTGNAGFGPVYVVATDKATFPQNNAKTWFAGMWSLVGGFGGAGDLFEIAAANNGEAELKGDTYVHIFALNEEEDGPDYSQILQSIGFHTSCSEPLRPNDQFGSVRLVSCELATPLEKTAQSADTADANDCCKNGEGIGSLTLQYKGWDREVMVVAADTDKYLTGSGEPKPNATVWFQGVVAAGGSFTLNALPGEVLGKSTWLHVSDPEAAEVLETVLIPTSCDQPIRVGDLFGPFDLQACSGPTG